MRILATLVIASGLGQTQTKPTVEELRLKDAEIQNLKSQLDWAKQELTIWNNPEVMRVRLAQADSLVNFQKAQQQHQAKLNFWKTLAEKVPFL